MEYEASKQEISLIDETLRQIEYFNVLEYIKKFCYSDLGKEIILRSKPLEDPVWLRKEHELVWEMTELLTSDTQLPLAGLRDVRQMLHKSLVQNAVLTPPELVKVMEVARVSRLIRSYFQTREEKYPNLSEEMSFLHENRLLEKHINDAIDEAGEVRDNATRELSRIRRSIIEKSGRLRSRLQKILKHVAEEDMAQEEFITLREGRFVLPVKSAHKRQISGIIHGVSQTGQTVFLEPAEIIEMNNELSLLMNEEKREIYRILSNLTSELGNDARELLRSLDIIAHLDSILAKARYALEFGGIKPEITEDNYIYLKDVRHPLLVHAKGRKDVIPLSLEFTDGKRGHLISGPNAGGKTVALKSIGISIAMALSGIFPFGVCRTNIRSIFSSIGDHQSIENDLSTFSSQILQLKEILSFCGPGSLVLVDEIGSGTDPQEGAALAAGILDTLIELKAFFVATTHQSSLKTYALNRDVIENASLEFDQDKLKPTYKFLEGIPGNSYAFVLAKNLGMSRLVLERAGKYLGSKQKELEESISVLQKYRSEAENNRRETESIRKKALASKEKYETKFSEIKAKRNIYINKAKEEAAEIVANANAIIENTVREIKEKEKSVGQIKKEFKTKKETIVSSFQETGEKSDSKVLVEFKAGDAVAIEETNTTGSVIETDPENKMAVVEFNGLKFRLPYSQLTLSKEEAPKKRSTSDYIKYDAHTNLDIRGKRADEGLRELDDFIADALVGNIVQLNVVHGKGTGALRHAVQEFLKHHHHVESFRDGTLVEGGSGVTIIKLYD